MKYSEDTATSLRVASPLRVTGWFTWHVRTTQRQAKPSQVLLLLLCRGKMVPRTTSTYLAFGHDLCPLRLGKKVAQNPYVLLVF